MTARLSRRIFLRVYALVVLAMVAITLTSSALNRGKTTSATPNAARRELGNTVIGFGSANWAYGQRPGFKFAVSVRAGRTGTLDKVWICWKSDKVKGYAAGNLGRWTFELQTDMTDEHIPSGEVLARLENQVRPPEGYYCLDLPDVTVQQESIYHLVIYNTDPHPEQNWSSPNTMMSAPETPWRGRGVMNYDPQTQKWAPWGSKDNRVAPWQGSRGAYLLEYTDHVREGMPYYSATERRIYGAIREGEQFVWIGERQWIAEVGFSVFAHGTPAAPLHYALEEIDTGILTQGEVVTPQVVTRLPVWYRLPLEKPVALQKGKRYRLYLSAPDCTSTDGYATFIVYSSEQVPGWPELTWGGSTGSYARATDKQTWEASPIPADLSFSLIGIPKPDEEDTHE